MNRACGFALVLAVVAPAAGDDKRAPAPSIRGTWEVTGAMFGGSKFSDAKGRTLVVGEQEITVYDEGRAERALTYSLNPKTDPPQIDLERDGSGMAARGIYSVERDELKLCYAEPGADRPTRFESKPGTRVFLLILKRVKE